MDKVFTDYPFVDVLVYYVKQLGMNCIVKSETEATNNETQRTEFMGDLYIQSVEGTADWRLYDYTVDVLARAGVPSNYFKRAVEDPIYIPEDYRDKARDEAAKVFITNYVEENNYYRKITGLPNLGAEGLLVPEDLRIDNIGIDYKIPLHEMDDATISELEERGIIITAIRPPTVPVGESRLRMTVTAAHSKEQLDYVAQTLHELLIDMNIH